MKKRGKFEIGRELHPFYHRDHKRPVTRRDFLAQGFITGAGIIASPSLFGLRQGFAKAQATCAPPPGTSGLMAPFICFDLAGGANIAGSNVMVGGPLGQQEPLSISGYSKLGLPDSLCPQNAAVYNNELGLIFHSDSPMLQGILEKTKPTTRANVNGAVFCSRSLSDTQNNYLNPLYGIAKVGSDGNLLTLIGSESSESGGNSMAPPAQLDLTIRPTKVSETSDPTGLVNAGRMIEFIDQYGSQKIVEAIQAVSNQKIGRLEDLGEDIVATALMRHAYADTTDLLKRYTDPSVLDPITDTNIFGLPTSIFDAAELDESTFQKTASIMKLVVEGHAGAGCIELGGYDYHDSTRSTGEAKDLAAGRAIGACLEYAARSCSDVVIYVFSDGSLASNGQADPDVPNGKGIWKSDDSTTAAAFMLVYSKDGTPNMIPDSSQTGGLRQQIGYFSQGASVEIANEISDNPTKLGEAVILNYLALHGLENEFYNRLPSASIGQIAGQPLQDLLAFQAIR